MNLKTSREHLRVELGQHWDEATGLCDSEHSPLSQAIIIECIESSFDEGMVETDSIQNAMFGLAHDIHMFIERIDDYPLTLRDCGGTHKFIEDCMTCTVCGQCSDSVDEDDVCADCLAGLCKCGCGAKARDNSETRAAEEARRQSRPDDVT